MKKYVVMLLVLLLTVVGCSQNTKQPIDATETVIEENPSILTRNVTHLEESRDTCSYISHSELYQAMIQLKPTAAVASGLIETQTIQQLKIKSEQDYTIAWTEEMTASPELPVLVVFNEQRDPIYMASFREGIESVKYIGDAVLGKGIIEVTSSGGSGSYSGQWVNLLLLDNNSVEDIWEFETIFNEVPNILYKYIHSYSTYLMIPRDQLRFPEVDEATIIVNQTNEIIHVNEDNKVTSKESEAVLLRFVWNEEQRKFIETD